MMAVACGVLFPAAATAQSYELVTAESQLENGMRYLIVAQSNSNYYAWNGLDTSSGKVTTVSAPSSNIITSTEAVPVQLEKSGDYWKIIDTETEQYVGVYSESSNYLEGNSSYSLWKITIDGAATVQNVPYTSRYLKFNYNLGSGYFGVFGNEEQTDIALYKEVLSSGSPLTLYNGIDNSAVIDVAAANGGTYNVTLKGRTLKKDDAWNTLCLPFGIVLEGSPLGSDGVQAMTFDTSTISLSGSTLTLNFTTVTSIPAGTPFIIKWAASGTEITNPTFTSVTIDKTLKNKDCDLGDGKSITFCGTYTPIYYTAEDKSILLLGDDNTLYYPKYGASIKAQRAYFLLSGLTVGDVAKTRLFFGDEYETTGIFDISTSRHLEISNESWYDLQGRKFQGKKPTKSGLYIHGGRKVVIK